MTPGQTYQSKLSKKSKIILQISYIKQLFPVMSGLVKLPVLGNPSQFMIQNLKGPELTGSWQRKWINMAKKRLGKGLSALISEKKEDSAGKKIAEIFIDNIEPNPFQPRENFNEKS